jgi:hypothetical protein
MFAICWSSHRFICGFPLGLGLETVVAGLLLLWCWDSWGYKCSFKILKEFVSVGLGGQVVRVCQDAIKQCPHGRMLEEPWDPWWGHCPIGLHNGYWWYECRGSGPVQVSFCEDLALLGCLWRKPEQARLVFK